MSLEVKTMPILEYQCPRCGKKFDELVRRHDEEVLCPSCKEKAERVWAGEMYSATGKPSKQCGGNCGGCEGCH